LCNCGFGFEERTLPPVFSAAFPPRRFFEIGCAVSLFLCATFGDSSFCATCRPTCVSKKKRVPSRLPSFFSLFSSLAFNSLQLEIFLRSQMGGNGGPSYDSDRVTLNYSLKCCFISLPFFSGESFPEFAPIARCKGSFSWVFSRSKAPFLSNALLRAPLSFEASPTHFVSERSRPIVIFSPSKLPRLERYLEFPSPPPILEKEEASLLSFFSTLPTCFLTSHEIHLSFSLIDSWTQDSVDTSPLWPTFSLPNFCLLRYMGIASTTPLFLIRFLYPSGT